MHGRSVRPPKGHRSQNGMVQDIPRGDRVYRPVFDHSLLHPKAKFQKHEGPQEEAAWDEQFYSHKPNNSAIRRRHAQGRRKWKP